MREIPPETVRPFVFSDPAGKRWPRLRLVLLIAGVLFFLALVVFVQTLFVSVAKREPCRTSHDSFASLAEVRRGAPGCKKGEQVDASEAPEKIAG